jgi:hypothetical protein
MSHLTRVSAFVVWLTQTYLFSVGCAKREPPLESSSASDAPTATEAGGAPVDEDAGNSMHTAAFNDAASSELDTDDVFDAMTIDPATLVSDAALVDAARTPSNPTATDESDGSPADATSPDSGLRAEQLRDEQLCERVCAMSAQLRCANDHCPQYCVDQLMQFREECAALYRSSLECMASREASEFSCDEYDYVIGPAACSAQSSAVGDCLVGQSRD